MQHCNIKNISHDCLVNNKKTTGALIERLPMAVNVFNVKSWLSRHFCPRTKRRRYTINELFNLRNCFILIFAAIVLVSPTTISSEYTSNQHNNKHSDHLYISQLCAGKSQIPVTKRIEGAVLSSTASDIDVNCTITFRTRSGHQHFVIRFEELKLGCEDHLVMFDGDSDYGQPSFKDFSCRDSLASVSIIKTAGNYLTMRFSSDNKMKLGDGFRMVATAVFDVPMWDCPADYALCRNRLCISKSLFCDEVNHCIDNSDETSCSSRNGIDGSSSGSSFLATDLTLSNALGLLVVLVLIIFSCVIIFITAIYCRRESHYAQYQHHLQRAIGVPLQSSSSLVFTNPQQPQYHYFQPANLSPYMTPQHQQAAAVAAAAALAGTMPGTIPGTLPRGYSTLPLNLVRQQHVQQQQMSPTKQNNFLGPQHHHQEYLMMASLAGPPTGAMQAAPTMQTNLFIPTSQSILATGLRNPVTVGEPQQQPQPQQQQQQVERR